MIARPTGTLTDRRAVTRPPGHPLSRRRSRNRDAHLQSPSDSTPRLSSKSRLSSAASTSGSAPTSARAHSSPGMSRRGTSPAAATRSCIRVSGPARSGNPRSSGLRAVPRNRYLASESPSDHSNRRFSFFERSGVDGSLLMIGTRITTHDVDPAGKREERYCSLRSRISGSMKQSAAPCTPRVVIPPQIVSVRRGARRVLTADEETDILDYFVTVERIFELVFFAVRIANDDGASIEGISGFDRNREDMRKPWRHGFPG